MTRIEATIAAHHRIVDGLVPLRAVIERLARHSIECILGGGRLLWAGNGGSAADCQHLAGELVGRFEHNRRALPSIALTTDTSILTAVANDHGFEQVFARQLEALARPNDILIAISTSGNSPNIVQALHKAAELGVYPVLWTGADGGRSAPLADLCIRVPATNTARIQEAHILIGHILCDLIEQAFVDDSGTDFDEH